VGAGPGDRGLSDGVPWLAGARIPCLGIDHPTRQSAYRRAGGRGVGRRECSGRAGVEDPGQPPPRPQPGRLLGGATIVLEPAPQTGPVVVSIEYDVADDQEALFLTAMDDLRLSRLRSGASRWELHRVGESPEVFVEQFQVPTWAEHLRQHEGRLTGEDEAIEAAGFAHVLGTPRTRHYLPPATARTDLAPPHATSRPSGPP